MLVVYDERIALTVRLDLAGLNAGAPFGMLSERRVGLWSFVVF